MGNKEHLTAQVIAGEWGSLDRFAESHGISPASTKMVIYVDGAKSRPVMEAMLKYGYLQLLAFEKWLKQKDMSYSFFLAEHGLNPVDLIFAIRNIDPKPAIRKLLMREGFSYGDFYSLTRRAEG